MFEKYIPRAESMGNNSSLILAFILGSLLAAAAFLLIGSMLVYFHTARKHNNQVIYLPLGICFLLSCVRLVLEVVAVWSNYAWVISGVTALVGISAAWLLFTLPYAITQRRQLSLCLDIKQERELLERRIEELRELKAEIKKEMTK